MENNHFSTQITVDQSPQEVINAVCNIRGWWSEEIAGSTDLEGEVFTYHYKDVHICRIKVEEMIPGKKVVWRVLNNHFSFVSDDSEWVNNRILFEVSQKDEKTILTFTHEGLVPNYECYEVCFDAWTSYIQGSLKELISTGTGKPNASEGGLNQELIEKWGLPEK